MLLLTKCHKLCFAASSLILITTSWFDESSSFFSLRRHCHFKRLENAYKFWRAVCQFTGPCFVLCVLWCGMPRLLEQRLKLVICDIIVPELLSHNVFLEIWGGVWPIQEVLKKELNNWKLFLLVLRNFKDKEENLVSRTRITA